MKDSASGLRMRFFSVKIAIGRRVVGIAIGPVNDHQGAGDLFVLFVQGKGSIDHGARMSAGEIDPFGTRLIGGYTRPGVSRSGQKQELWEPFIEIVRDFNRPLMWTLPGWGRRRGSHSSPTTGLEWGTVYRDERFIDYCRGDLGG